MDYTGMTTTELRDVARKMRNENDERFTVVTGLQIAAMKREELLARINGDYKTPEPAKPANDQIVDLLAQLVGDKIGPAVKLDENRVNEIVSEYVSSVLADYKNGTKFEIADQITGAKAEINAQIQKFAETIKSVTEAMQNAKKEIEIKVAELPNIDVGMQHSIFEKLLKLLVNKKSVFLVGPSGSGKTHIAQGLAKALSVECYYMIVGMETSKADFFGYRSITTGEFIETDFYKAYVNGGLILIDEIDAGSGNTMTMLNMALDNGHCAFPNGLKKMHEKFYCIASGNTYGRGSDRMYCGRNPLDGATLQRFKVVFMDYDEQLEKALCPDTKWVNKIQTLRRVVADHKAKVIVSMRAVIEGWQLKCTGFDDDEILNMTVWQGYNNDAVKTMMNDLNGRLNA